MRRLILSLFLSFLSLAPLGNAYADSYLNVYSFEQPSPDPTNPFWPFTIVGDPNYARVIDQVVANTSRTYLPTDGTWFLDMAAGNLTTSATFTFTNVIPNTVISFDWAFLGRDQVYKFPAYPHNDYASVTVNGTEFRLSDIAAVGDYGDSGWQTFSFLAPSETVTISFSVTNIARDSGPSELLIDNIRINQMAPPVPEASTWLMLLAGLGLVARRAGRGRRLAA